MKKLTAVMAAGAVAVCAYASAENTVTLKRDVLGRALGANQKQPVLLKNTTVKKTAEPLAATLGDRYASMKEIYAEKPFNDGSDKLPAASGAFIADGMPGRPGYKETYYYNDKSVSKSSFLSMVNDYENIYRRSYRGYVVPKIAIPSSFAKSAATARYTIEAYPTTLNSNEFHYNSNDGERYLHIEQAHANTGVDLYAHNNLFNGYQANVFVYDEDAYYGSLNNVSVVNGCVSTWSRGADKRILTSRRVSTVKHTAPDAWVYQHDADCYEDQGYFALLPANPEYSNLAVGLMNRSAYAGNVSSNSYGEESAILDDYIYYNRVVGVAPMKIGNNYAVAENAVTVGGVNAYKNSMMNTGIANPTFAGTSRSMIKPEISNYGYLYLDGIDTYKTFNGSTEKGTYRPFVGGEEAAASYTAGIVSDLISSNAFYKWHPEVVKALLLTTAEKTDFVKSKQYAKSNSISSTANSIGMSLPDFGQMITNNRSRYWIGNNASHFNSSKKIEFTETNIVKGARYRIAIAWLMRGDYMISKGSVAQDIDLSVIVKNEDGSETVYSSVSVYNGYEMVDFVAPSNKDIRVVIKRPNNHGGRVLLGYNLHKSWN